IRLGVYRREGQIRIRLGVYRREGADKDTAGGIYTGQECESCGCGSWRRGRRGEGRAVPAQSRPFLPLVPEAPLHPRPFLFAPPGPSSPSAAPPPTARHHGLDVAALRGLYRLHPGDVLQRPVRPAGDGCQAECREYSVPAVSDYRSERYVVSQVLVSLGVLFLAHCYFTLWTPDINSRLNQLGLFCSIFTISMYLSPLADLAQIIKSKSTKCLSFPLTVATFLTSTSWVLYGWVQSDLYITVPNFPGIVTSLLRFWLFSRYPPDQPAYSLL
uniref:Sugar transporter SWEET n=2 Tax=Xenopus tropicalis TaxID=8364 RepID=F7BTG3_XENTR